MPVTMAAVEYLVSLSEIQPAPNGNGDMKNYVLHRWDCCAISDGACRHAEPTASQAPKLAKHLFKAFTQAGAERVAVDEFAVYFSAPGMELIKRRPIERSLAGVLIVRQEVDTTPCLIEIELPEGEHWALDQTATSANGQTARQANVNQLIIPE